jgi:hypothetical protein
MAVNATSPWLLMAGKVPKVLNSPVESVTDVNSIAYFGSGLGWHKAPAHVRTAMANTLCVCRRLLMFSLPRLVGDVKGAVRRRVAYSDCIRGPLASYAVCSSFLTPAAKNNMRLCQS